MTSVAQEADLAVDVRIGGAVQGVGFRPFIARLASRHGLGGWVLNTGGGVEIHVEGRPSALAEFRRELEREAPPAARIRRLEVSPAPPAGCAGFEIRASDSSARPTLPAPVDMALCDDCLAELLAPSERRHLYPYLSCAACGPRYSILLRLPYDRAATTMAPWPLCEDCAREYEDPADRRYDAQPIACPACGPGHRLVRAGEDVARNDEAFRHAARALACGEIVALKSLGGYHLACDATDTEAVSRLRARKHRDEKPFALMARDLGRARGLVDLSPAEEELLLAPAHPIVIARARRKLEGVAPGRDDLGIMLPHTPAQHLLFRHGAPPCLVMTSGNRSDDPIAYADDDALDRLAGIADVMLVGERPVARRLDDSVAYVGPLGPVLLRRGRGYAPGAVAEVPSDGPVLALGADLKSTVTIAVAGQALMSQHLGDLGHVASEQAFRAAVADLLAMYGVEAEELLVVHDLHPHYVSTRAALDVPAKARCAVQHHRAHVASVLAERSAYDIEVVGIACDGTGWGDDGSIWGGEIFTGSVRGGLVRVAHLRTASLPGGDAAARHPAQAAAGFLAQLDGLPDLCAPPFAFPGRYREARTLVETGLRSWRTTSVGRLFDAAAALCGFTRPVAHEGQAAMWLEQLARRAPEEHGEPMPFRDNVLDWSDPLLRIVEQRARGDDPCVLARRFHTSLGLGLASAAEELCETHGTLVVALSGGVFQNRLLLECVVERLRAARIDVWTNGAVPPNDGGVSLGQVALASA